MVAKQLGGTKISIPQAMRNGQYKFKDSKIGLVFPIYGLSVPPIVLEFLKKAEFETQYLFSILTYGTYDAGSVNQLVNTALEKAIKFDYVNCLHMQENYLPGFAMEKQKKPDNQDEKLQEICKDIEQTKHFIKKNNWFDRFMTKTHQASYHYSRGVGVTDKLHINESCIGCGVCEKVCPTKNITIRDRKPTFGKDCLSCLACVQNCPNQAITLDTQKSNTRYRNPTVELAEIIEANK